MSWTARPSDAKPTRSRHLQAKTKHQLNLEPPPRRSPTNLSGPRLQRRQPSATIQRVRPPQARIHPTRSTPVGQLPHRSLREEVALPPSWSSLGLTMGPCPAAIT